MVTQLNQYLLLILVAPIFPKTKLYQSIVGCINWLSIWTHPDISPVITFLAYYSNEHHQQHYKSALRVLNYLTSNNEYEISFHSRSSSTIQAFNQFPNHHYNESYTDPAPPFPSECHQPTTFCDACWGGQFGSLVDNGTPMKLFNFSSLSGFLIFRSGSPIDWKSIRHNQTTLIS